jgi:GT2 family glycosyltransferase
MSGTKTPKPNRGQRRLPKIRVIVLNFNGGELTIRCLRSLAQAIPPDVDTDLVMVDNASSDGVVDRVEREFPEVRIVRSDRNRGFAGGNNLALRDLDDVDLVALVNNDVTVSPEWLGPLVEALRADPGLGAASPKILFDGHYRRLDVAALPEPPRPADRRALGVGIVDVIVPPGASGRVRFGRGFYEPERAGPDTIRWSMPDAMLFVPVPTDSAGPFTCELIIDSPADKRLEVRSGDALTALDLKTGRHRYEVALGGDDVDLINNVGSMLLQNNYAADRGWLEPDQGQYAQPEDVFAWSGGAVLLRTEYLRDVGLFDERLFLYYEDLELSWRGRRRGWRYGYVPGSTVRHVHAATATQDSAMSRYFNERNRLLVLARHAPLRVSAAATFRFVLSTLSYVRRDVAAPVLRGSRPRGDIVLTRLRAFGGFLRGLPSQLRDRVRHK